MRNLAANSLTAEKKNIWAGGNMDVTDGAEESE
jgi:hypothetical protein